MTSSDTHPLAAMALAALARDADKPAVEFEGRWRSWGEMRALADQVRRALANSGAHPRAPIAFVPRNTPPTLAAFLALVAEARTVRMIYPFQSAAGIARDVTKRDPGVLILSAQDCSEEVLAAAAETGAAVIALTDMNASAIPGFAQSRHVKADDAPSAPQVEILTSGTTGPPKPFIMSYDMLGKHFARAGMPSVDTAGTTAKAVPALLYFTLGNISGLYTTLPALLSDNGAVLLDRFTLAGWHAHLKRYQPAQSGLPPAGVQMLLDSDIPKEDLACIKAFGAGAAPLDPTVHRAFEERYGIPILLSYGATEFGGPVIAMTLTLHAEWGDKKFGSVGKPMPGMQARVVDPDTGEALPLGSEGLLQIVSHRIGPDWIPTSDVAFIDEDGFVFHRGRADGAIVRGGFKLLPETIERALLTHAAVAAAAVVGVADRRLGQTPGAVVQFKPGASASVDELETHLRQNVLATHIPTHWRFVEGLPRTPSFKVDRAATRALFETAS